MPIVGGVQAFFLNPPAINFNLIGVADVLDLPGFKYEKMLNKFIFYFLYNYYFLYN